MEAITFHFWNHLTELCHRTKIQASPLSFLFHARRVPLTTQNNSRPENLAMFHFPLCPGGSEETEHF